MPQDQTYQIIIDPGLAEALAKRDEARNADRIAAGQPPIQYKSPFITRAQIDKEEKNARRREKRARAHDTAAAKAQIASRCQSNPSFARHARKCAICNHPDCDSIESDFVNWRSENIIALNYQLPSRSSVYRHAAAVGLVERRRANLRGVCERIIERADEAPPSGMAVLRALRIYSQITEDGHWVEPPKRSLVTHVHISQPEPSAPPLRDGGEGPAVHDGPQNGTAPEASLSVPDLDYVPHGGRGVLSDTRQISASTQIPSPIGPNPNRENNLDASPAREILIGTQNASRESASHGKRGG